MFLAYMLCIQPFLAVAVAASAPREELPVEDESGRGRCGRGASSAVLQLDPVVLPV
jgi:hypothetical protein